MAEGILLDIAGKILGLLGSRAVREGILAWGVKDEVQKLKTTVNTIKLVLRDAEEQHSRINHEVIDWIQRLKDAFYEADDLLDDFSTHFLRQEALVGNKMVKEVRIFFSKSNQIMYSLKIAHKIKTIREKLERIKNDKKFHLTESLDEKRVMNIERETHSFVRAEKVIGRDNDKNKVVELLLDSNVDENVSIISIFGFGGLGKTTLAQLLYNDHNIIKHFQLKMWVCVSDDFNVKIIVEKILKSATSKKHEGLELDQLQQFLRNEINGKKYLLVLDDIWNENPKKWDDLTNLLIDGKRGSKILVTTRSEQIARVTSKIKSYIYPLRGLDEKKSWSLFTQNAFENGIEPKDSKLVEFGKGIVAKCGGVPLVIMTIGQLLYGNNVEDDWLHLKDNEMSKVFKEESDILPLLKLSYDHLPSYLKQCFAYCSLFPRDYKIKKQKLICLWMAQGFLQASNNECPEDVGNKYFMALLLRCLLQDPEYDEWGNVIACKMHGLMRDLAQLVAGIECTTKFVNEVENVDEKCRHLSLDCGEVKQSLKFPVKLYSAKNIRSLLLFYQSNWEFDLDDDNEILSKYKFLRTLDFGELRFQKLCSNGELKSLISELKHLRYLNVSYMHIEILSNSLLRLWNLETLDLSYCDKLKELPRGIRKISNLRHLINKKCDSLIGMPCGLGCLTNLQTLSLFVVSHTKGRHGGLEELNGLNNLRGMLKIKNLKYEENCKLVNLERKQFLQSLILDWGRSDGEEVKGIDEVVLEGLKPHPNLKKIDISSFMGVKLCNWFSSLTNLTSISIKECKRCQHIPPLGKLTHLKSLSLAYLDAVEYISEEAMNNYSTFFPSLKELTLYNCRKLKGWWRRDNDNGVEFPSFPSLSKLDIQICPELTFMPLYPSLEELKLSETSSKSLVQTMMLMNGVGASTSSNFSAPLSNLKSMHMFKIPDLKSLPMDRMQKLTSLVELKILSCPTLTGVDQTIKFLPSLHNVTITFIEERDFNLMDEKQKQKQILQTEVLLSTLSPYR